MLKFFFWVLLLANAALFAFHQGYLEALFPTGREPARMSRQLQADKIRLLPAGAVSPAPEAATNAAAAATESDAVSTSATTAAASPALMPVVANAGSQPGVPDTSTVQAAPAATVACAEIGNFNNDEAKRFGSQLAPLALGEHLSRRTVQETVTHIVYIPPQGDKEAADKKAGELRRLGVTDFFVIQDNSALRWGISLGVFKTEESARGLLTSLNQRGVRSARIGRRPTGASLVAFQLRDVDADLKKAVEKIKAGFPRQQMKSCEAA